MSCSARASVGSRSITCATTLASASLASIAAHCCSCSASSSFTACCVAAASRAAWTAWPAAANRVRERASDMCTPCSRTMSPTVNIIPCGTPHAGASARGATREWPHSRPACPCAPSAPPRAARWRCLQSHAGRTNAFRGRRGQWVAARAQPTGRAGSRGGSDRNLAA
eukprot:scaffold1135_cov343-Prasinococcus_capsulatus_cf.AAC.22